VNTTQSATGLTPRAFAIADELLPHTRHERPDDSILLLIECLQRQRKGEYRVRAISLLCRGCNYVSNFHGYREPFL
jgi:hypothetical protein